MNILVTGANGFIGKNLIKRLEEFKDYTIFKYDSSSTLEELEKYTKAAHFIFHLAGVNRPQAESEFTTSNVNLTSALLALLKKYNNKSTILFTSSIQAELHNAYGISKKAAEDLLFEYSEDTSAKVLVYRLPNVFGKWAKPNYNSVIATFAHNIARDLPIIVNDPNTELPLVYIDDLVNELINALHGKPTINNSYCEVHPMYVVKLSHISELLYSFKEMHTKFNIPALNDSFTNKLYATYLSYLPQNGHIYDLVMNIDDRGSFTEFIKTKNHGQVSVNIIKPGITKGNHWHHTKNEKFLVVSGTGVIRLRKIDTSDVSEYFVSGNKLQVVDIPPGYTHNIENLGDSDMVTVMWANEQYDKYNPDTIYEEV